MQKMPISVKARIAKAGYVLAPVLVLALIFYGEITAFTPAGYFNYYIIYTIIIIIVVQIIISIRFRKVENLVSLIISLFVLSIIFYAGRLYNLNYLGFEIANKPLNRYRDDCVTVPYFDGRPEAVGFCQRLGGAGQTFSDDIMIDSGRWIIANDAKRPRAWKEAFSSLATIAKNSELFQMAQIETIDDDSMQVSEIGEGFFVVSYSAGDIY